MTRCIQALAAVLLAVPLCAQFEIADVHSRAPNWISSMRSGFAHGRYELRNATMLDLIRTAWNVAPENVMGGPDWLETDRFDVIAAAPADSTPDTLRAMLRVLLEDRFGLAAHQDSRSIPAYSLTARKPRLQKAEGTEETGCRFTPGTPPTTACANITMGPLPKHCLACAGLPVICSTIAWWTEPA